MICNRCKRFCKKNGQCGFCERLHLMPGEPLVPRHGQINHIKFTATFTQRPPDFVAPPLPEEEDS